MPRVGGLTRLAIPALPRIGSRARKPKQPRPEYSVDIEGERRKRKRVTIEELSERGADILKEQTPDLPQTDKRSLFTRVTDILDIPRNAIANAVAAVSGVDVSQKREGTLLKKVYMSDILEKAGVPKGPVRSIIGFVGDVAIDPLTYATLGGGAGIKIAKHLPRGVGAFVGMAKTAAKTGKAAPELAKALNLRKGLPAIFAWLSKRHGAQKASKMLLAKQGGMLTRRIAREATKGAPGALELLAKYGEKARPLFRLPFAKRGLLEVLPGKRAARYKDILESLTIRGQHAHRAINSLRASVAAQLAKQTGKISEALELDVVFKEAAKHLKIAQDKYSQYLKAESAARKVGYPGTVTTKSLVRSTAIRQAERDVDIWKQIQSQVRGKYASQKAIGELKSKYEVSKAAEGVMARTMPKPLPSWKQADKAMRLRVEKLAEVKKGAPRITQYPAGKQRFRTPLQLIKTELAAAKADAGKAKVLTAEGALAGKLAAKRTSELARLTTGPQAPGVVKQLVKSQIGSEIKPGIAGAFVRAKRTIFGAPVTPVRQKVVAAHQQLGPAAAAAGGREIAAFNQKITPIIQKYAVAGKGTEDEIGQLIHHLAEAGPAQAGLERLPMTDALRNFATKAKEIGLADDPAVKTALADYWKSAEITRKLKGVTKVEGFTPGILTKESQELIKEMKRRGMVSPFHEKRSQLLTFELPGQKTEHVVSTGAGAKAKIASLTKAGYEKTATEGISHAQMNVIAANPKLRQTLLGPGTGGPIFKESLPEAAGKIAAQREQAIGIGQINALSKPYRMKVPRGTAEASEKFAHAARPIVRTNPVYKGLEKAGIVGGDIAYPKPVTDMLNGLTEVWEKPEMIEAMLKGSDKLLGIWKGFQLYHPAYLIRNVFQNFFGGLMAGANPGKVTEMLSRKELRALTNAIATGDDTAIRGMSLRLSRGDVPLEQMFRFGRMNNAANVGQTAAQVPKWKGPLGIVHRINTSLENNMRMATWATFMDKGMDMESAFMQTLKAMPDLTDLTIFEREGMARMFPWYRWMRRNGGLQLFTYLPQKPAYAAMLPKFKNFVEGFRGKDNVPDELRPMWQDEQAAMQITGGKEGGTTFLAQTWFPFEEMYQLLGAPIQPEESARRLVSSLRPGAKFLAEAATGQDIFRQTPREPIGGLTGAIPKLPAALAGRSGTALDTLLGLRPVREWGPGGRVAEMPTVGAGAQRAVLGGALQPVEYQKGLQAKYWELENEQRRLRALINRAEQAGDQALVASLTRQWTAIIQQMHRWKLPLPRTLEQRLKGMGLPQPGPP